MDMVFRQELRYPAIFTTKGREVKTRCDLTVCVAFWQFVCLVLLASPAIAAAKAPVPDQEAQQKAMGLLREVFLSEYKEARTPAEKEELARTILKQGPNCERGSADKYAVFRVSIDIASEAGAVGLVLEAIDSLGREFQVDTLALKRAMLRKAATVRRPTKEAVEAAKHVMSAADSALTNRAYAAAHELTQIAARIAERSRDRDVMQRVAKRMKEVEWIAGASEQVEKMLAVLDKTPDDPGANLVVGRFRCLVEGNWKDGLPMLALGGDSDCKATAVREMQGVANVAELIGLADAWYELAEKEEGLFAAGMRRHAAILYKQALPHASGLAKRKLDVRLSQLPPIRRYVPELEFSDTPIKVGESAAGTGPPPPPPSVAVQPVAGPPEATSPAPPAVVRTPGSSVAYARVSMPGVTPKPFVEGVTLHKNYALTNIPEVLSKGFVLLKGGNVRGNTTRFSVRTDGVVYLLLSGRPGGGGGGGPWKQHITKPAQIAAAGWKQVGKISYRGHPPCVVYARLCKGGESFELSWEKYIAPAVIAPAGFVE
jgi:hypothetical protein